MSCAVRSTSPPASVEPSSAPHPKSYMEVNHCLSFLIISLSPHTHTHTSPKKKRETKKKKKPFFFKSLDMGNVRVHVINKDHYFNDQKMAFMKNKY